MIRRTYLLILLLTCASVAAPAATDTLQAYWRKGQTFYQSRQYDSAVACFEAIAASGKGNAALYYNLGNAWYRQNDISNAVLNYERALFLEPGYRDAADNLALSQSRITNRIRQAEDVFFVRWWHSLVRADRDQLWAIAALLFSLLLAGSLVWNKSGKHSFRFPPQFYLVSLPLFLFVLLLAYRAADNKSHSDKAVVMSNNAPLTSAPGQSKGQSLIPGGTTVRIDRSERNWYAVTLPDGRNGWMQQESVTLVQPRR